MKGAKRLFASRPLVEVLLEQKDAAGVDTFCEDW